MKPWIVTSKFAGAKAWHFTGLDPDECCELRHSRDVCIYESLELQAVTLHKYGLQSRSIRTVLEKYQSHQPNAILTPLQKPASAVVERSLLNLNKAPTPRNSHNTQQIRQISLLPLQTVHHNDACRRVPVEKLE